MASNLYDKITLQSKQVNEIAPPKTYKGFSSINANTENFHLYDFELIRQDIINHFHIRQGEKLMNPKFGTIIWDLLYEPLTADLKDAITTNVSEILNNDPRVVANQITVTSYESGIQIQCTLTYLPYNIQQAMQLKFDQTNGLIAG